MEVEIEYRDFIAVSTILLNIALFPSTFFYILYPITVIGIILMLPLLIGRYGTVYPFLYEFSVLAIILTDSYALIELLMDSPGYTEASSKMAILTATWLSLASILVVKPLRSPLNTLFASIYLKSLSFALGAALIHNMATDIAGLMADGFNLDVFEELSIRIAISITALAPIYLLLVKPYLTGEFQGIYRHILSSYPPAKFNKGIPTYLQVSDLRFRVYRVYRVLEGDFKEYILEEVKRCLKRVTLYYGFDGYVYLYLISEAITLDRAVRKLVEVERILYGELRLQYIEEDPGKSMVKVGEHPILIAYNAMERPLPNKAVEFGLGTILTFEYRSWRYMIGLYTHSSNGRKKHIVEMTPSTESDRDTILTYMNSLARETFHVEPVHHWTPIKLRKGRLYFDGTLQDIGGALVKLEEVCIEPPLMHHIFLLGKTRSGKTNGLANLVKYINRYRLGKTLIFDWIGSFTHLQSLLDNAEVLYPGEDLVIDLYKTFGKRELIEVYEEISQLFYVKSESAGFTPTTYTVLLKAVENAGNHEELITNLKLLQETSTQEDIRNAANAVLRRLTPINPDYYTPIPKIETDIMKHLDRLDTIIIDLSTMETREDQTLYTLATLKTLEKRWRSETPLYIVLDEVHRLAPKTGLKREWTLERIAREKAKDNLYLILADQTLTKTTPEIWNNMGHVILFHIDNPYDLQIIQPKFSKALEENIETPPQIYIQNQLKLDPGEAILIKFGRNQKPIQIKLDHLKPGKPPTKIDEEKFREALEKLGVWKLPNPKNQIRYSIIKARKLIRKHPPHYIQKQIQQYLNNPQQPTLKIDDTTLLTQKQGKPKPTLTLKIYLQYHNMELL